MQQPGQGQQRPPHNPHTSPPRQQGRKKQSFGNKSVLATSFPKRYHLPELYQRTAKSSGQKRDDPETSPPPLITQQSATTFSETCNKNAEKMPWRYTLPSSTYKRTKAPKCRKGEHSSILDATRASSCTHHYQTSTLPHQSHVGHRESPVLLCQQDRA